MRRGGRVIRRLCIQCHRWIDRSEKWWAAQPSGPALHPGSCRVHYAAEQREIDAHARWAEEIDSVFGKAGA